MRMTILLTRLNLAVLVVWIFGCGQTEPVTVEAPSQTPVGSGSTGYAPFPVLTLDGGGPVPDDDAGFPSPPAQYTYVSSSETIQTQDGLLLQAQLYAPQAPVGLAAMGAMTSASSTGKFPVVIFVNSWTLGDYEYMFQAPLFAQAGYLVLSYATRGFGFSGGMINIAGPDDLQDLSTVLDWLAANTPADMSNIGLAGISYGGGISLMGASLESRIKTAVSMSGFVDLERALWGGETPRLLWGLILVGSGYFTGNMDPTISQMCMDVLGWSKMDAACSWFGARSPINYIDRINAANKPIYLSNNMSDELFSPNPILDYYAKLTGPKRLDLNQGEHAQAEIPGALGLRNYVWGNVHDWFDYWLKGIDTGIMNKPPVSFAMKFASGRAELDGWPASTVTDRIFYLYPRNWYSTMGALFDSPYGGNSTQQFWSGLDTVATSGLPVLSSVLQPITGIGTYTTPALVDPLNGVVYQSPPLDNGLSIRGKATLHVPVSSSLGKLMLVAYLYDLDGVIAQLLTYGVGTIHDAAPFEVRDLDIDMSALAHDIAPGHRLVVAVDTFDLLYAPPTLDIYSVDLHVSLSDPPSLDVQVQAPRG
jgi:predicted acyl esterase